MGHRNRTKMIINSYGIRAQEHIQGMVRRLLGRVDLEDSADTVFTCVDELIKNAIKANYRYVCILDEIHGRGLSVSPGTGRSALKAETAGDRLLFESHAARVVIEAPISERVRKTLDEESRYMGIIKKAYREGRTTTPEEKKAVSGLAHFQRVSRAIMDQRIVTTLAMELDGNYVVIEVANTAPMLPRDMDRIREKIAEFRLYQSEGRGHEFFVNNLDTSEAGYGLGYAVIESCMAGLGIDSEGSLSIHSEDKTTVRLSIPLHHVSGAVTEVEMVPLA